jgi:hypothetical protein
MEKGEAERIMHDRSQEPRPCFEQLHYRSGDDCARLETPRRMGFEEALPRHRDPSQNEVT